MFQILFWFEDLDFFVGVIMMNKNIRIEYVDVSKIIINSIK